MKILDLATLFVADAHMEKNSTILLYLDYKKAFDGTLNLIYTGGPLQTALIYEYRCDVSTRHFLVAPLYQLNSL